MATKQLFSVSKASENMDFIIKTDGTTKEQKKLEGVAINDIVVSVNEVPDKTAHTLFTLAKLVYVKIKPSQA